MIAYVEHPVTPKQKVELKKQGFKILDVQFKPKKIGGDDKVIMKQSHKK